MNEQIKKDLVIAMKNQDKFKLSVLRMLKSALEAEKINKKHDLSDDEIIAVIKKQVKVRNASKEEFEKYNREETVKELAQEIEILNTYLPEELSLDELNIIIDNTIKDLNATNIKDMGLVIKTISSKYASQVDMSIVSKIVKEKLNN